MNFAIKVALLIVALCFPVSAMAQEVTTGAGIICDTKEQLTRYAALYEKGALSGVVAEQVNKEVGKDHACGVALVAFIAGENFGQVRTADGPFTVTEILVVAANLGQGWQKVQPFVQFTLVAIKETEI